MTKEDRIKKYNTPVEVKCTRCGTNFVMSRSAYNYRIRIGNGNPEILCKSCRSIKASEHASSLWNNLTDDQKKSKMNKMQSAANTWMANMSDEEKSKWKKNLSDHTKERWQNYTDEELKLISSNAHKQWEELPKEIKNRISVEASKRSKDWWNNLTLEEKQTRISNLVSKSSETKKNYTDEQKSKLREIQSKSNKLAWENMSEERKREISENAKLRWLNLPDDERGRRLEQIRTLTNRLDPETRKETLRKIGEKTKERWANMSPEELKLESLKRKQQWIDADDDMKNARLAGIRSWWANTPSEVKHEMTSKSVSEVWRNRTETQRKELADKIHSVWENRSVDMRNEIVKKALTNSGGVNKFHKAFISLFLTMFPEYTLYPEYPCTNNDVTHFWDYGVFNQNNDLVMVIDLDGAYFHADECDYDGMHSKIEYDTRRCYSIPDQIKHLIIQESKLPEYMKYLSIVIPMTYDEWVVRMDKEYKSIPFPQPRYTNIELMKSFDYLERMKCDDKYHKDLSLNTRLGDRLIHHFHSEIYDDIMRIWNDDLSDLIRNHTLYHCYLNRNKILQSFEGSWVSGAQYKMILYRYAGDCDTIVDPLNNDCLALGTISLHKSYIRGDQTYNPMLEFLSSNGISIRNSIGKITCLVMETTEDIYDIMIRYICDKYIFIINGEIVVKEGNA